eukprot:6429590-Prymnesium_polylepis.1
MGTRESPPVRSRDRSRGGSAEEGTVVSPAKGLWSGGRLAAARETGWVAETRAAGAQPGSIPRAVWLQREVAEKRRRGRSEAAAASSPSSPAGGAKRASAAGANHWHGSTSPMST